MTLVGLPYHRLQRGGRPGAWRPVLGVVMLTAAVLVVVPLLIQLGFMLGFALVGRDVAD